MIVSTTSEMQKHLLSLNLKLEQGEDHRFASFLGRAQDWVTANILGVDLEETLEIDIAVGQPDPHAKLRELTGRVISELAYLDSVPESDLQRSEAGFVVQSNEKMSPASQQRVDRLVQSLNERLNTDCDALVSYLLNHSGDGDPYDDWRATEEFSYLTMAFMPTMTIVRQYGGQGTVQRWKDFCYMMPKLATILRTSVANYVSIEEVEALLELYRDQELMEEQKKALRWIRMAVMAEASGKMPEATRYAIEARQWMLKHESSFPAFVASDRYELPSPFNMGDGTVANLL